MEPRNQFIYGFQELDFPANTGCEVSIKILFFKLTFIITGISLLKFREKKFINSFSLSVKMTSGFKQDFLSIIFSKLFNMFLPTPKFHVQPQKNLIFLGGDLWEAKDDDSAFLIDLNNFPSSYYTLQANINLDSDLKTNKLSKLNPKIILEKEDKSCIDSNAIFSSFWKEKLSAHFFIPEGTQKIYFYPIGKPTKFHLKALKLFYKQESEPNKFLNYLPKLTSESLIVKETPCSNNNKAALPTRTEKNKIAVVIGMHRSGTSLVSRILNIGDYYLGDEDELLEPDFDNEKGFWENKNFMRINERILMTFQGDWDKIPDFPKDWLSQKEISVLASKAEEMVKKFAQYQRWGWKDPRTTITLPFWKRIIAEVFPESQIYYILCIRNPIDVAKSLQKRNNMTLNQGSLLWEEYTKKAIQYTANEKRIFVNYENFFYHPEAEIKKIDDFLMDFWTPDQYAASINFIDQKIRHQNSSYLDLFENDEIPESSKLLYAAVLEGENLVKLKEEIKIPVTISHSCYPPILDDNHPQKAPNGNKVTAVVERLLSKIKENKTVKNKKLSSSLKRDEKMLFRFFTQKKYEEALKTGNKILQESWLKFQNGDQGAIRKANEVVNKIIKNIAAELELRKKLPILSSSPNSENKIKLAFIKGGVVPNDGPTMVLLSFCRNYDKNKFSLKVYDTYPPELSRFPNYPLFELNRWKIPYFSSDFSDILDRTEEIVTEIQQNNTDITVIFGSMMDIPCRLIACCKPAKVVFHYDLMQDTGLIDVFDLVIATEKNQLERHTDKKVSCYIQGEPSDIKSRIEECNSNGLMIQKCCLGFKQDSTILGTFGRLTKITNPAFLTMLAELLREFPQTCYITAGPGTAEEINEIRKLEASFPSRVKYLGNIGYLEANLLLLLDIYLNSFPLPGGQSFVNALGAGLPAISMPSKGGIPMGNTFSDDIEGYPQFPSGKLEDAYTAFAKRAVKEVEFRNELKKICSDYFKKYLDAELRVPVYEEKWVEVLETKIKKMKVNVCI